MGKIQALDERVSAQVAGTDIEGVQLRSLIEHRDDRGSFTEIFQNSWKAMDRPCQWSFVRSVKNTFRGCHLHKRHDEFFCLLNGEVSLGLRDERPWSPSCGNWQLYRLYGEDLTALIFPAGLIHGWYFHTDSTHVQSVSESYISYNPDDNWSVHWADPNLGIPWPFENPVLVRKATEYGTLSELKEQLLPWSP